MKKLFIILAILLLLGFAKVYAAAIPVSVNPYSTSEVWTQEVYNNSSSAIASGVIVIYDYDTSDVTDANFDDTCPWVKVPTGADDIWTAGVVPLNEGIPAKSSGRIVIRGPTWVRTGASGTVNTLVGATASTGYTVDYAAGTDLCAVGRVIKASSSSNVVGAGYTLVDVGVMCSD